MGSDFWGPRPQRPGSQQTYARRRRRRGEKDSSAPKTAAVQWTAAETAPEASEDITELKTELEQYIGLDAVKQEVNLINMAQIDKSAEKPICPGLPTCRCTWSFRQPGTGKTTIARIMARTTAWHPFRGHLEVDRSGLVAGYVGRRQPKPAKSSKRPWAACFSSTAYALNGKSENDFGQKPLTPCSKPWRSPGRPGHRVAGYDGLMETFVHSNPAESVSTGICI